MKKKEKRSKKVIGVQEKRLNARSVVRLTTRTKSIIKKKKC